MCRYIRRIQGLKMVARLTREEGSGIILLPVDTKYPKWKITIGGEDVTPYVIFAEVVLVATHRLSYANLMLDNDKGRFNDKWDPTTERVAIKVYFDYATASTFTTHVPTNQIFEGKLDKNPVSLTSDGWIMNLSARDRPELFDMTTTIEFDSENVDSAIKSVIADVNSQAGYTVISEGSIEATSTKTSRSYRDERYINILADLCDRAGFDARINTDGTYDAFTRGSEICLREGIASGANLFLCPPIGPDATEIRNYIKGYGPDKEGCLLLWTKKSSTLTPWRKDEIINDTSIQNLEQLKDRLTKEYDNLSDAESKGSLITIGLPYLKPGQALPVFVEYVYNGTPSVEQVSHIFSMGGVESRVSINELEKDGLKMIRDNDRDIREKSTFNNPNNMTHSYHFTFDNDDDIETHSGTETANGKLKLTTGNDTGTAISKELSVDENMNYAEIRFNGNDDCDLCTFDVSTDGSNYEENVSFGTKGEPGDIINITNPGKKIKVKIHMKSSTAKPTPEIESCVVLSKT